MEQYPMEYTTHEYYLQQLGYLFYVNARNHGFWPEDATQRNFGEAIALIHSELSEALEAYRKGGLEARDEHLPHRPSVAVELADAVIRILDLAEGLKLPVAACVIEKHFYNVNRPIKHGKNF